MIFIPKPPRILVIDDELTARLYLQGILERHHFEIVAASSGEEGLELLKEDPAFDLILLDYLMPGLNGIDVLKAIKTSPKTSKIKVIMISGLNELSDELKDHSQWIADYVPKPFQLSELITRVNSQLHLSKIESELFYTQAKYQTILDQLDDPIIQLKGNQTILYANPRACEIFGCKREELITFPLAQLFSPGLNLSEFNNDNPRAGIEKLALRCDKNSVPVKIRFIPLPGETNDLSIITFQDLREQRKLQKVEQEANKIALSRSAELEIMSSITDAINQALPYDRALQDGLVILADLLGFNYAWITGTDRPGTVSLIASYNLPHLTEEIIQSLPCIECKIMAKNAGKHETNPINPAECKLLSILGVKDVKLQLSLPIRSGTRMLGSLNLASCSDHNLDESTFTLLAALNNSFANAIEQIHLYAETVKSLQREERLNEVTQAISSSLDMEVILADVVRLAVELVDAQSGAINLISADSHSLVSMYQYNLSDGSALRSVLEKSKLGKRITASAKSLYLSDLRAAAQSKDYNHSPMAEILEPDELEKLYNLNVTGILAVPLLAGKNCFGLLILLHYDIDACFEPRELDLAEAIGKQAGIAIRNAQFIQDMQKRSAEVETLQKTGILRSTIIAHHEEIDRILEQLQLSILYDSASIQILDGDELEIIGGRGLQNIQDLIGKRFKVKDSEPQRIVFSSHQTLVLDNVKPNSANISNALLHPFRSWMGVPLINHGDITGLLVLDSMQPGHFTPVHLRIANALADEISIALENARVIDEMQWLAITDPLTNLYNRRHFFELAQIELVRSIRYSHSMSIIMFDIDHFKRVNDSFGHTVGDEVLRDMAQVCLKTLRKVDVISRYGGEEFVILLPETNLRSACNTAERLRKQIAENVVETNRGRVTITASLGVAYFDGKHALDLDTLLNRADQAMYNAKNAGRNQACEWEAEMEYNNMNGNSWPNS
jgi:diguanylate cyclase (GGDEF)-like protein